MNTWLQLEGNILLWIQDQIRCPALTPVMRLLSTLGNGGVFWIVLTLAMLAFRQTRRTGMYCAVAMLLTFVLVNLCLKPLVDRVRPYEIFEGLTILVKQPSDASFPSGHSANSMACAWTIFRTAPRKYGVWALILALLIALSRLYVGVHFPTDVLSGLIIGAGLSELSLRLMPKLFKRFNDGQDLRSR